MWLEKGQSNVWNAPFNNHSQEFKCIKKVQRCMLKVTLNSSPLIEILLDFL